MKTIMISFAIIAVIAAVKIAHAREYWPDKNSEKMVDRVTEKLSLDTNQQAILQNVLDEKRNFHQQGKLQREARKSKYKAAKENGEQAMKGPFEQLINADQMRVEDINHILDERHEKIRERRQPLLAAFVDFRNSLTVEQRQQAKPMFRKLLQGAMRYNGKNLRHHAH